MGRGDAKYDAIILGGGPAGLSAALILGRCRRRVVVCDAGRPRNARSRALHGFITRDGVAPGTLLAIARRQLAPYGVEVRREEAVDAQRVRGGFEVGLASGARLVGSKLLIATGVADRVPDVPGIQRLYGSRVFHCPYCDGWEVSDRPLAVYGQGRSGAGLALSLKTWTPEVALVSNGPARIGVPLRARLREKSIDVVEARIARVEATRDGLAILFEDGGRLERRALFFSTGQDACSALPRRLGCRFDRKGAVKTDRFERTGVPGLYVAGDASHDVQLAIVAAAEGAKAAFAINRLLQEEEGLGPDPSPPAARR